MRLCRFYHMRKHTFRPSLAETKRRNQQALDFLRAISPNEDAPQIDVGATPKRERTITNTDDGEGPVLSSVGEYLAAHPSIAIVVRLNSGAAVSRSGAPIWFHRLLKGEGVMVDYFFVMRAGTFGVMECKRADWRGPSVNGTSKTAERERKQAKLINQVRNIGGPAGFVRSVAEAQAVLLEWAQL